MTDVEHRDLDAEIHTKVMGKRCVLISVPGLPSYCTDWFDEQTKTAIPAYSKDLLAAFTVLEQWEGDFELRRQNGIVWKCELFRPSEEFEAWEESLPLAICRAALKALKS